MNLGTVLAVGLAGAAGSVSRYLIGVGLAREQVRFPVATMLVNVVGAFLIGLLMVLFASRGELDSRSRIALTTGFLGGFTTYSAFAYETVAMMERREFVSASIYVSATLVTAGIACFGGMAVARYIR